MATLPEDPRWTASVHEAGHARVALHYGLQVSAAVVPFDGGGSGVCYIEKAVDPFKEAVVNAAGPAAEAVLLRQVSRGAEKDRWSVIQAGMELGLADLPGWYDIVLREASGFVIGYEQRIWRIAVLLYQHEQLTHEELRFLAQ